jgi:hypothetical protein
MGMTIADFCELTLNEYQLKVTGFQMKAAHEWDKIRHIMFYQIITAAGKSQVRRVQDVLEIPLIDKGKKGSKNQLMKRHLERNIEQAGNDEDRMRAQVRLAEYEQKYF